MTMSNLIIAPHIDDETLGCGGIMAASADSHVFFCGVEEFHEIPREERLKEAGNVAEHFGYTWELYEEATVNRYDCNEFVDIFQELINRRCPERMFIPYPSYNQDHQEVYHAAMIALRPHDRNHFVKKVLVYDLLDCFWYAPEYEVNYFVPIDIVKKLAGYNLHSSQVRGHRSFDQITALATLRGAMIGVPHAEAFIIKRWVE